MSRALLSPSDANRWVRCQASVIAQRGILSTGDRTAATAGQETHRRGAELIRGACRGLPLPSGYEDPIALEYAAHVIKILRTFGVFGGPCLGIETPVNCSIVHSECHGTPDFWVYDETNNDLMVIDLKTGYRPVRARDNWQLICYALGVAYTLGLDSDTHVYLRIFQPTISDKQFDQWPITLGALKGPEYLEHLQACAEIALDGMSMAIAGHHCYYCKARYCCDALQSAALDTADYLGEPIPNETEGQTLATELTILNHAKVMLTQRLDALTEHATAVIRGGSQIPGWQLSERKGRLAWTLGADETAAALGLIDKSVTLRKPEELITPTQAIAAGLDPSVVAAYAKRSKPKLVLREDNAKEIFNG